MCNGSAGRIRLACLWEVAAGSDLEPRELVNQLVKVELNCRNVPATIVSHKGGSVYCIESSDDAVGDYDIDLLLPTAVKWSSWVLAGCSEHHDNDSDSDGSGDDNVNLPKTPIRNFVPRGNSPKQARGNNRELWSALVVEVMFIQLQACLVACLVKKQCIHLVASQLTAAAQSGIALRLAAKIRRLNLLNMKFSNMHNLRTHMLLTGDLQRFKFGSTI